MTDKKKIGPWRVASETTVYDNPWIKVVNHEVIHPNGAPGQYCVVQFKNLAIGVLPIDQEGFVPLVGQHRFPLDQYSWEVPEGGGPLADDPLLSAKRELQEETGFKAASWLEIASFDLSNSVTNERSVCFLAWGLTAGEATPEPSEELAYERIRFSALYDRVIEGEIRDSLTIIMVLKVNALKEANRLPSDVADLLS